jgi:hypothetical protein
MSQFLDEQLICVQCGLGFVFSAGERELLHLRGLTRRPNRCPACRRGAGANRLATSRVRVAEVSGPAAALAVVETLDIDKPCVLSWASVEEPARRSK